MVGVEIGGTFTDLVLVKDGQIVETVKVPSTPDKPADAAIEALGRIAHDIGEVSVIVHGSTVATNSVLERKGARTALLVTEGFGDILDIQSEERERIYDLRYKKSTPIVRRDAVVEVKERIDSRANVVVPLDLEAALSRFEKVISKCKIESVAICFIHADVSRDHERVLESALKEKYPDLYVCTSSDILPEFREYNRASTTVINAFVTPKVSKYLHSLESQIFDRGFTGELLVMQSNGGISPAEVASRKGAGMLLSGPAAGAVAAIQSANSAGFTQCISLDMGGTSADVCLSENNNIPFTTDTKIDGLPVRLPMADIVTIGAGGGSLAHIDVGGMLRVGPESSGADPGPACYGRGGSQPTVTDANVVLGFVRPAAFLGGKMPLDLPAARAAFGDLAGKIGTTAEGAAEAVYRVVNANMAQAIRLVSVERGFDPRDFVLVSFGGAGPLHGVALADELDMKGVLVPEYPGLLSAHGLLLADFKQDYVQTAISRLSSISTKDIRQIVRKLEMQAEEEAMQHKAIKNPAVIAMHLDMRYKGQAYEIPVEISAKELEHQGSPDWLQKKFDAVHLLRYGHAHIGGEVEIVNYRLSFGAPGFLESNQKNSDETKNHHEEEKSKIYYRGKFVESKMINRKHIGIGETVKGPAVIEEENSTTLVPPGWQAVKLPDRALSIQRCE